MKEEKLEGIVLKSHLVQENHRLIFVYTNQLGMIHLFAKHIKYPKKMALVSSFAHISFICHKKKSDLYQLKEGSVIGSYYFLREKWDFLEIAGKMGRLILQTQMPGKPSPLLYNFFLKCLKHIPFFTNPLSLLILFYVKFFTHEGLISWDDRSHFPFSLSIEEWKLLKELGQLRSFKKIYHLQGLDKFSYQFEKII